MKSIRLLGGALIIALGAYLLGWSNIFSVKSIEIGNNDKSIVAELRAQLNLKPAAITIGEPIARVDKREISARLRELIWVDSVVVNRNIFTGEVSISVKPRAAIARISESQIGGISFLGDDLKIFTIPTSAVSKAAKSGGVNWRELPTVTFQPPGAGSTQIEEGLRKDALTIMELGEKIGAKTRSVSALDRENLASQIEYDGRKLDISWGNVKELDLKSEVLIRLLELKENKRAERIDLRSPLSPVVS